MEEYYGAEISRSRELSVS